MKISPAPVPPAHAPLARPFRLKFPKPFTDAELLWLGAHNEGIGFEQSAAGVLLFSPPTGGEGIAARWF